MAGRARRADDARQMLLRLIASPDAVDTDMSMEANITVNVGFDTMQEEGERSLPPTALTLSRSCRETNSSRWYLGLSERLPRHQTAHALHARCLFENINDIVRLVKGAATLVAKCS